MSFMWEQKVCVCRVACIALTFVVASFVLAVFEQQHFIKVQISPAVSYED